MMTCAHITKGLVCNDNDKKGPKIDTNIIKVMFEESINF